MATSSLAGRPGRGGITINARGDQATVGFWPEKFDRSPTGWTGQLRDLFGEAVRIGQRHHTQNEAVLQAKVRRQEVELPEPKVRQSLARAEQKRLAEVEAAIGKITHEAFGKRAALKPFAYEKDGLIAALNRQELRATLRSMNAEERASALKSHAYRAAALELRPEQAGLAKSEFDLLYEAELATKFPEVLEGVAEAMEAAEVVALALKAAKAAVAAELVASGGTIAEPAEVAPPQKAWA
jgi:hypothetical protein